MTSEEALKQYVERRNKACGTWSTERAREVAALRLAEALVRERYRVLEP